MPVQAKRVVTFLACAFLCLAFSGACAFAQTYYVDPNGSDSSPGGESSPWQTLQHAVENASPGDVIMARSGTYAGCRIEKSGTSEAYITLMAEPGQRPVINSPGPKNRHNSGIELETWQGDGTVSYWVIDGLEVANIPGWGIDLRASAEAHSHHITVRNNNVHHCGLERGVTGIFLAFVDDALIQGNHSHANGEHGIYVSNSSDRAIVRGNFLYDNANCGLHMNGDLSMGGDGTISGCLVEANTIYNNGAGGGSAINNDGVTDSVFRNNLLYNNHAGGFAVFQGDGAVCSQNNRYLNNTVVQADDGRWAFNIPQAGCVNNKVFNNILYINHGWRGSITIPAGGLAGFESDYNIVVDRFSSDGDESVINLGQWQALGYDAHSKTADPNELFVNPGACDYRLKADSPAVDAGAALPDVTDDLAGTARPQGAAPDIGAYEYSPGQGGDGDGSSSSGSITYALSDRTVYRLEAKQGAQPENISAALDQLSPRKNDEWLNISPDGQWLLLSTGRFDPECDGWACLALVKADMSSAEAVRAAGSLVRAEGFSAVASGGGLIVYVGGDGPHERDLFAITRQDQGWSAPVLLTGASPHPYHELPAISADGTKVIFNAGPEAYAQQGALVAEVGVDGQGYRELITPAQAPEGMPAQGSLNHPDYTPEGGAVFEADWAGEQIWALDAGSGSARRITDQFGNDNSPCVLPDGRIVSLWLNRPQGQGYHEIKVMQPDGSAYFMALTGVDVFDVGLGCGR